ncbi:MAG: DUF1702 family protein [Planctomycetes bacterium]|nr:DUF1702 family protein [Planctomycetota bacterium]
MLDSAPIRRLLFGISPNETSFARRGFPETHHSVRRHLETAAGAFVDGYNAALAKPQAEEIVTTLNNVDAMYSGFAFEGAAMGLALLDLITPWNRGRLQRLINTPEGDAHLYMLHVGAGWAIARIPWARRNFERAMARHHRLYRWLTLDGYGFHQGFFHTRELVVDRSVPRGLSLHAARVFDQGLGRSLWFSQGADVGRIAAAISAFPASRRSDLWSGAGLAATYAGGVEQDSLDAMRDGAAGYETYLAQGAAFAAKARQRAGNTAAHTELACHVFCRMTADEAAAVTDECLENLSADGAEPAYQVWRTKISERFSLAGRSADRTMSEVTTR